MTALCSASPTLSVVGRRDRPIDRRLRADVAAGENRPQRLVVQGFLSFVPLGDSWPENKP